ncbi:MAG: SDR family oxidoreductase [Acidobacteriota bacterium]
MDLGIKGRRAIVCASSRGLGRACATSLAREGVDVVINGRTESTLEEAAESIRALGAGSVTSVVADISTTEGRDALLAACPEPDILINNNGGPPPGRFSMWTEADWEGALQSNLLAPTFLIQAVLPGMEQRRFGRIVNITSAMVKAPHHIMGLSTSARSALTALCKGLSRDVAENNVTINNLLPERFDTDRQEQMAMLAANFRQTSVEHERQAMIDSIAAKRLGQPNELGDACAFLCSVQASYISGQNLQLDGGSFPGLI